MADIYLTGQTPDGKKLSIAPISSRRLARCVDAPEDSGGYFLTEECPSDPLGTVTILARIADIDAAMRLGRMFSLA